jgi:putative FmdB family regulatory protein
MPTYEYQCTRCGAVFELFQQITEKPKRTVRAELKNCTCDAPVQRLIGSGAGVLFRGTGFYETDYRSESYRKAAKAEKESQSPSKPEGKKPESATTPAEPKPAKKGKKGTQAA